MANHTQSEQLDKIVERMLGRRGAPVSRAEGSRPIGATLGPAIEVVRDLHDLPRAEFRSRLKVELAKQGSQVEGKSARGDRRANMASTAKAAPEVRTIATPYLSVRNAAAAIEFYKNAFGATEAAGSRFVQPDGRVGHAEIDIGGAKIMLADEFPEYGFRGPESLGGSPVRIHLSVPDVDAVGRRIVAAGGTVLRPVEDQFYGDRSGAFRDPFGHTWTITTRKEDLSMEEMQKRFDALMIQPEAGVAAGMAKRVNPIREGFHSVTPYLIVPAAAQFIAFIKAAFGAEERFRVDRPGTKVIMHAEVRIGDSMLELADANEQFPPSLATLILQVDDVDASFRRALQNGATVIEPVSDQASGARGGTVLDASGNRWNICKSAEGSAIFKDYRTVTLHFNPVRAPAMIEFLQRAFGAEETYRAQHPDGTIPYAQVRIGDSVIGMGEPHGPYQPRPATLHLYVPDTDAVYERALRAGATSIQAPADQPYGDRSGGVQDPFGNRWFIATHIRDVDSQG